MINNKPTIRILVTGGTFDKEYDEIKGELYFNKTHIPELLNLGRSRLNIATETLMMIDSLEMTDLGRDIILTGCREAEEDKLIITNGTDTMVKTAAFLAREKLPKTIILTGAIIPYKFGSSDGFFNLGNALAFAQTLPAGVYIAMNGRWFHYDQVEKNKKTGDFEKIPLNK